MYDLRRDNSVVRQVSSKVTSTYGTDHTGALHLK